MTKLIVLLFATIFLRIRFHYVLGYLLCIGIAMAIRAALWSTSEHRAQYDVLAGVYSALTLVYCLLIILICLGICGMVNLYSGTDRTD